MFAVFYFSVLKSQHNYILSKMNFLWKSMLETYSKILYVH